MAAAHPARSQNPSTQVRSAPKSAFGVLLKQYRLAAGLTQEDLAERAELSIRGISDLERGERRAPRRATLVRLATALSLSPPEWHTFEAVAKITAAPPTFRPCNLSAPPTRLIGRDMEVAEVVAHLMRDDVRLITLTGAGGVGKTRLAQEVALTLRPFYAGRVWQVELAHLRDAALVTAAVAGILGLEADAGASVEATLMNHLNRASALLLFDTFEHLSTAAPFIDRLHRSCPELRFLVTSRKPLDVPGEQQWLVRPLPMPDPECLPSLSELPQYGAVSLFMARAQAVHSSFALTSFNAAAVIAICRRLDGLPLALELAATWLKILLPKELLAGLERRLWQLTRSAQNVPERQRSLYESISWSYQLLSAVEKALFRRLAVFVGGCTMAAVEFMCRAGDELGGSLLDHLASLLNHNLLYRQSLTDLEEEEAPRFGMLETLREFGIECLIAVGELGKSRERHAAYFLAMADGAAQIEASDQVRPTRLDLDHANVRAAREYRRGVAQATT